jgi:hypothetical protein
MTSECRNVGPHLAIRCEQCESFKEMIFLKANHMRGDLEEVRTEMRKAQRSGRAQVSSLQKELDLFDGNAGPVRNPVDVLKWLCHEVFFENSQGLVKADDK